MLPKQPSAVLVKTSLVDFPGHVAAACFLRGCNLRCPYCYNTALVIPGADENAAQDRERAKKNAPYGQTAAPAFVRLEAVIEHLKKRKNVLSGFVISGGEPLVHPKAVRSLILAARSLGYKIKLDTNGLFPDALESLLADAEARPDYIALDLKTSPARYAELCGAAFRADKNRTQDENRAANENFLQDQKCAAKKIARSIQILSALPADAREFRTVLYPPLVSESEIKEMASLLPSDARWYFARFMNGHCLDADAEKIAPCSEAEERALLAAAKKIIPGAEIR